MATARENDTRAEPMRKKPTVAVVVKEHITACEREQATTVRWTGSTAVFLGRAVAYSGAERRLGAVTPEHGVDWIEWLRQVKTNRGRPMAEASVRHHLVALSALYLDVRERPKLPQSETRRLGVPEAALVLEAARTYPAKKREPQMTLAHPLLAAFLLAAAVPRKCSGYASRR